MIFINPNPSIPNVPFRPDLADALSQAPNQPIALFPVRLETRYIRTPIGAVELRVRIYPDKAHIETHEPELTDQESLWGREFWDQTWHAGNDDAAQKAAWQQLAGRLGAERAAWVARALTPTNAADRPTTLIPLDQPLPAPIVFPTPPSRADAWSRAPVTHVMPKRWYLLGYVGGALTMRAVGNVIPDSLPVGPDPTVIPDPANPPSPETPAVDPGMKWMVDFDEAERVGMGIRVLMNVDQAAQGFDILMVVGTKSEQKPEEGMQQLANLLDSHHYADGLAFILNGTPSNNTPDAPSGFSTVDLGEATSYASERANAPFAFGDGSNADMLATALGLRDANAQVVTNLLNANATEQRDAFHMNRALWAATLGYYLPQMLGVSARSETPMSPADFAWARSHFINFVRASGPLPAIRIGRQPYGVLPVTSLTMWKPKTGQEAQYARDTALKGFLLNLREVFRRNLSQVPRVTGSANGNADLSAVLAMDGLSSNYTIRHLMGTLHQQDLWFILFPVITSTWFDKQRQLTTAPLSDLGLVTRWNPVLTRSTFTGFSRKLTGPTIQTPPDGVSSDSAPLQPNYIDMLLNAPTLDVVKAETFPDPKPRSLLYSLLRHSMLQEYWNAAANLTLPETDPGFGWSLTREQEISTASGNTFATLMAKPIAGVTTSPASEFLHTLRTSTDANVTKQTVPLFEFRDSLAYLKTLSAGRLQRALAGTLDLCSHRLDAWFTSFATKRLAEMRAVTPTGMLIGGYGWVTNLKPAALPAADVTPVGETGTVFKLPNNPGFNHTPSIAQANTTAVLRSGQLSHNDPSLGDALALDLSSERVRLAAWLLDGVRQGQPLGALLGYRFERRLHDAHLDVWIPFFRDLAPLVARKLEQTTQSVESIAANNVVDGLRLQRMWKAIPRGAFIPQQLVQMLFAQSPRQPDPAQLLAASGGLFTELERLDAAADAVSDALLAESVHHAVQGNPLRTAATLDAIATGEAAPPELDFVDTPRTGIGLTYRIVTLFGGSTALPPKWTAPLIPHRMSAEPYLNQWAAKLLGDPTAVRVVVERIGPDFGEVLESREVRLSELRLAALDLIYANEGSRDTAPSEIEQRVMYLASRKEPALPSDSILRINGARQPDFAATDVSYAEFVEVLRTARKLVTGARGIDASDLATPGQNQPSSIDLTELTTRADRAESAIRSVQTVLTRALATPTTTVLETLRSAIMGGATFGIAGAIPFSSNGDSPADRATLLAQGTSVNKELLTRLDQLTALKTSFVAATATPDETRDQQFNRLRAVFGKSFVVLPRFTAPNALELQSALGDSAKVQDNDTLAAATWFQRASRVRDGVSRLDSSLRYAESLETGEKLSLRVAQLPYQTNDRWVALPLKPGKALSSSRFSLIVQSLPTIDVKLPMTGLLIDEWVEVMPNPTETTGISFQYDQPDAMAPQSILLAVPPDPDTPWNLWQLQQVLLETFDMARIRAIDPDTLDEVGHYLPAMSFAANITGDTVSTDFGQLR